MAGPHRRREGRLNVREGPPRWRDFTEDREGPPRWRDLTEDREGRLNDSEGPPRWWDLTEDREGPCVPLGFGLPRECLLYILEFGLPRELAPRAFGCLLDLVYLAKACCVSLELAGSEGADVYFSNWRRVFFVA
jgi:hypothetical protein